MLGKVSQSSVRGCMRVVAYQGRPAFAHRLHDTSGRSWSQRTFSPLHESHARGRLKSPASLADPGVAWAPS